MGSRAVHYDAGLRFLSAAGAEPVSRHSNIQLFRFEDLVVLRPRNLDRTRIRSRNRAAAHKRIGTAGDLVGGGCRPQRRPGVGANVKAAGKVIEAVVALGHHAYAAVRFEILVFDDSVHIVADVVVASGSCGGHKLAYGYSSPYPYRMDIPVAGGPNLGKARIDRGGLPVIRRHFRFGILIHAVDGDAHSPRHLAGDGDIAHGAHGIDLALGIRRNIDGRMIALMFFIRVDTRIVQESPAVFVVIRNSSRALEIEVVLAPAHTDAGAYRCDAGFLQFLLVIDPAVRSGNCNRAVSGGGNVRVVDLRAKSLLVARGANGRISHGAADAHFFAANGNTARHGGLFRQFLSRDGKRLQVIQRSVCPVLLAVDDAFRVADAPVDSHSSHSARIGLSDIHVHAACYGQRLTRVPGRQLDGIIPLQQAGEILHVDVIACQVGPGSVVEGIVGKGQPHGHALSARHLAGNIEDGGVVVRLGADFISIDRVICNGNPGIVLQVVPAAGTGAVEGLAANGNACAHRNDQGVRGRLAVYNIRRDGGAFDVRRDVILYIVIGNARAGAHIADQAAGHGGGDGDAVVLAQQAFEFVLVLRGFVRDFAFLGIFRLIVQGGFLVAFIEIALPRGVYARVFQGALVIRGLLCVFLAVIRVFLQGFLQPFFRVVSEFFFTINLLLIVCQFGVFFIEGCLSLDNGDFSRLDIECPCQRPPYCGVGNIGMGGVLRASVSKSAIEAVAAFPSGHCAVDLGGSLLGLHIYRSEILIAAADDAAGQVVFQITDGYCAANAHIGIRAAGNICRQASGNLEIGAGGLVGKHTQA